LIAPIKGAALAAGLYNGINNQRPLGGLDALVEFCGLAYQGRNDIDDIIPSSHRSSDLDGRKPNLLISLFALHGPGCDEFNLWYQSEDKSLLAQWQRRIASSDSVLQANESIDYWLLKADKLVNTLPIELQPVAHALVASVKLKTNGKRKGRIA
jgi:octaprenyl-diphosphate synthase